jgi:hypothetical protein
LDKNMRQHNFMSGLICHALDQGRQHYSLIPNRLFNAQFELQHLIRDLSNFFDTFTFRTAYVHPTMLFLQKEFTALVKQHFLEQQPELFSHVNEWLDNIVTNQQKQRQGQQLKQHRSKQSPEHQQNVNAAKQKRMVEHRAQQSPEQQQNVNAAQQKRMVEHRAHQSPEQRQTANAEQQKRDIQKRANLSPEELRSRNAEQQKRNAARASAQRQLLLNSGGPATPAHLAMAIAPDANYFVDAAQDPIKTLLLFAYNSGHAYLPFVKDGVLPHSSECPAIMAETWCSSDDVPEDVRKLHDALLELVVSRETIDERVRQFRKRIPLEGLLLACASCGVRDVFINDDEVGSSVRGSAKQPSKSDKARDQQHTPDLRLSCQNSHLHLSVFSSVIPSATLYC